MLNQEVLNKMNDSEKTDHSKVWEDYWQANDEVEFGMKDKQWLLDEGTTLDELIRIRKVQFMRGLKLESKMRKKYIK